MRRDEVKVRSYKPYQEEPNLFFQKLYETNFSKLKTLRGEDHTGQLKNEDRIDREERFRADFYKDEEKTELDEEKIRTESISALFCSPTMELGVDISALSVVHMRNAPPNAANYAQRRRPGRPERTGGPGDDLLLVLLTPRSEFFREQGEARRRLRRGAQARPAQPRAAGVPHPCPLLFRNRPAGRAGIGHRTSRP